MRDMNFPLRNGAALDLARANPQLRDAATLWLADYITVYEDARELSTRSLKATRVSLPSDRSFGSFEAALAHVNGPALSPETDIPWQQAMLDVLFEYPVQSERARFSIRPALARLGIQTTTVLRFVPPQGPERAFQYVGDPGVVRLDPRWWQAAVRFVTLGFAHIMDGIDHLLFVLCLVIPVRRWRPLVAIVTAFTVAHTITLCASAAGFAPNALWFPPLVEVLVALSIVWMAFENIVAARTERRWMMAFGFGLVHGFAFSFALRDTMQFAGSHLVTSLLAFNLGVELGQLLVVAIAVPALAVLFRRVVPERPGTILLSALVAHTAWHWLVDRGTALRGYVWHWPSWDLGLAIAAMRLGMLAVVVVAAAWGLRGLVARLARA